MSPEPQPSETDKSCNDSKVPIILCIDVEPDARAIEPTERKDWEGFERTWKYFTSIRPSLELATGAAVHYSWFVRMDPQIAYTYGAPDWAITRYGDIFASMQQARDEIGLHPHAWRWDDAGMEWVSDFADQKWIGHCVELGFEHYARRFKQSCRSFRFGDRWLNQQTAELIERYGVRFDLTVEPGRKPEALLESFTGGLPDYTWAPRLPYRPSTMHFLQPDTASSQSSLWMIPISTASIYWAFPPLSTEARTATQPPAEAVYEGYFDFLDQLWIEGWVYDARHPDEIVNVDLYDDGRFVANYAANVFRPDLLQAGKGAGAHGFVIPVPDNRRDQRSHELNIRVSGSHFELNGSPKTVVWHGRETWEDYRTMNLAMNPLFFGRLFDALLYDQSDAVLALVLRTGAFSNPAERANCEQNLRHLRKHPMANRFVGATPAEALELVHTDLCET